MKRGKRLMTEQERQRTIDFILRSQADAVIRQDRWEERMEERMERWEERWEERWDKHQREMEKLRVEVREFAKAAHEALEATRKDRKSTRLNSSHLVISY